MFETISILCWQNPKREIMPVLTLQILNYQVITHFLSTGIWEIFQKMGGISPGLYSHPNKQMIDYYHLWYSVRTRSSDLLKSLCPVTENKILSCKPCNGKGKVVSKLSPQGHNLFKLNSSLIQVNETPINIRTEYKTTNKDIYAHSYLISCWKIDRQKLQEAPTFGWSTIRKAMDPPDLLHLGRWSPRLESSLLQHITD
jgi:hypothetical protein